MFRCSRRRSHKPSLQYWFHRSDWWSDSTSPHCRSRSHFAKHAYKRLIQWMFRCSRRRSHKPPLQYWFHRSDWWSDSTSPYCRSRLRLAKYAYKRLIQWMFRCSKHRCRKQWHFPSRYKSEVRSGSLSQRYHKLHFEKWSGELYFHWRFLRDKQSGCCLHKQPYQQWFRL